MGRTKTDIYTTKKFHFRPLPTTNQTLTEGRQNGIYQFGPRSLAELCQLGTLEGKLPKDIFTVNMIDPEVQKELLKVKLEPKKALELAISIKLGARS